MGVRMFGEREGVGGLRWVKGREERKGPETFWVDFLQWVMRLTLGDKIFVLIPLLKFQGGEEKW